MSRLTDTLAHSGPRLLVMSPLIAAAAVATIAVAPAVTTGVVVAVALQALASVAGNIAATDIYEFLTDRVLSDDVFQSQDLVRATTDAIGVVIRKTANEISHKQEREAVEQLASLDVSLWLDVQSIISTSKTIQDISTNEVLKIFSTSTDEFATFKVLEINEWRDIVCGLAAVNSFAVEGDIFSSGSRVVLSKLTIDLLAQRLYTTFPRALFEVFKADFAKDGKAYGELLIRLVSNISSTQLETRQAAYDLLNRTAQLLKNSERTLETLERTESKVDQVLDLVSTDATQDYDSTLRDYLRAVSIFAEDPPYLALDQILSGEKRQLKDIYVPLRVRLISVAVDQHSGEQEIRPSEQSTVQKEDISPVATLPDLLAAACKSPHGAVLLQGAAGAGKSTGLRHITAHAFSEPHLLGLNGRHLPMVVRLQVLASVGGASLDERLLNSLRRAGDLVLKQTPPNGFFLEWSSRTQSPWLLLLDGLDEVAVEQREQIVRWIKGLLRTLEGQHLVVLTSRPNDELYRSVTGAFTVADVLPFDEAQQRDFAKVWFTDEVEDFLTKVNQVGRTSNRSREPLPITPLLLTIAATVYRKNGDLPGSGEVELYGKFIEILFEEAERRGLWDELGEEVADVAKGALEEVALSMTADPKVNTFALLTRVCAEFLAEQLRWNTVRADVRGKQLLEVLSKRAGVFYKQGEIFQWAHPTFRDYLAAEALDRKLRYSNNDYQTVLGDYLKEQKWRSVLWTLSLIHKDREELIRWISRMAHDTFDASVASLAHECWQDTESALIEKLRPEMISAISGGLGDLQSSLGTEARLRQHLIEIGHKATEQIVSLINNFNGLQQRLLPEWDEKRRPDMNTEAGRRIYSGFHVRYNLIDVLGQIADERSVEPLISWMTQHNKNDYHWREIADHARRSLKCIGLPAVDPLLIRIANVNVPTEVRLDSLNALSVVGARSASVTPVLEACLNEGLQGDAKLLANSLQCATVLRDREHSGRAMLALTSENKEVVAAAASYLAQMPEHSGFDALNAAFTKWRTAAATEESFTTYLAVKKLALAINALNTARGRHTISDLIKAGLTEQGELSSDEAIQLADEARLPNLPTLLLNELLRRVNLQESARSLDRLVTRISEIWRPDDTRQLAAGVELLGSDTLDASFSNKLIEIYLRDAAKSTAEDQSFGLRLDGKSILQLIAKCGVKDFTRQAVRLLPGAEFWLVSQVSDALWLVGDPSAEDALIKALDDFERPSMQVDQSMPEEFDILRALGTCSTERGADVVINYVRRNPDLSIYLPEEVLCPLVRRGVLNVNTLAEMAVDAVGTHEYVRRACVLALGNLDAGEFAPTFLEVVANESDELTRGQAAFFLGWAKTNHSDVIRSLTNLLTTTDKPHLAEQVAKSLVRMEEQDALQLIENTIERFQNPRAASGLLLIAARFQAASTLRLLEKVNVNERSNMYARTENEIIAAFGEFYHSDSNARAVVDAQIENSSSGFDSGKQRIAVRILAVRNPNALLRRATTLYDQNLLDPSACGTLINCIPQLVKSQEVDKKWLVEILKRFLCDQSLSIREAAGEVLQFTTASLRANIYDQLYQTGNEWAQACAVYSLGFWDSDEREIESARFDCSPLVRRFASIASGIRAKRSDLTEISRSFQINRGLLRLSANYSLLDNASEATVNVLCREMKEGDSGRMYLRELRGGIRKRASDERQKRAKDEEGEICERRRYVSFG
jgi:HEAT repeat protein/predicted DNA-binding protein YlxM (UPF0122 family)